MTAIPLDKQDINVIQWLDFQTHDYAYTPAEYSQLVKKGTALSVIASVEQKKVGFAIWERGARDKPGYLLRLGVMPNYRLKGIGRKILGWVCDDLRKSRKSSLKTVLSQNICLGPNDPLDVSGFMVKSGFICTGTVPDAFFEYGKKVEGLTFERKL